MDSDLVHILQSRFGLSDGDLDNVRRLQRDKEARIDRLLLERKIISEPQLLEAYSILFGIPFWPELPIEQIDSNWINKVPINFLRRHLIIPLLLPAEKPGAATKTQREKSASAEKTDQGKVIIALHDPADFQPLDDLCRLLDIRQFQFILSTRESILAAINLAFDLGQDSAEKLVQDMEENEGMVIQAFDDTADLLDDTSDAPIIKLVNHIISQSIKARASDIHIEPYQDSFKVRYRVDGILYDLLTPPRWIQPALTSRIKVMAKLNIAEKRLPQDGRFEVKVGDNMIDVRVSTLPTSFGERVVMRLLNKSAAVLDLAELGLSQNRLAQLKELVKSPNGIILVTGPTGSGKTTTLYSVLSSINTPDINIITIEDPVEYQLRGISQIQVNPKIDLTFARGLRSIVRQDPDVILVGEIRDRETAEIAVQSALTGHLVFSTLHTNDSASAITRLVDIGVEPFLISSSVVAVIAQRLVRVLCAECKEPYDPKGTAAALGITEEQLHGHTLYRATGCEACFNTGYRGRVGIFEIMVLGHGLKSLIQETYDSHLIKREALKWGMVTLRQDGVDKILKGITTIEEVLRVTQK